MAAQQPAAASSGSPSSQVPPLIQFSNVASDEGGNTLSGAVSITFSLYAGQRGGEPLWTETQNNVPLDSTGHYSVQLGITKPNGVPTALFTSGEARWLGVQIVGQAEQPRVLLLSVPYALKAGDAATIGGLPPSAFVLAAAPNGATSMYVAESATGQSVSPATSTDVTTSGGTVNYLPLWDATSDLTSSVLFQSGTGSPAKIGINTATPAQELEVDLGNLLVKGTKNFKSAGNKAYVYVGDTNHSIAATYASGLAIGTYKVPQAIFVQDTTGDVGIGTTTPAYTLDVNGTGNFTGLVNFAAGQTFPGTGDGTITGVTAGTDLTGGGTSGNVALNVDTTKVPQLAAANTFTGVNIFNGNQTVNGTFTAASGGSAAGLSLGFGSLANQNAFLAWAGGDALATLGNNNTAVGYWAMFGPTGGSADTAVGSYALEDNAGSFNTAMGSSALALNNVGQNNTAVGYDALYGNTTGSNNTVVGSNSGYSLGVRGTGSNNTAVGANALFGPATISNATAIGWNAEVTSSNSLVLGSISGVNGCATPCTGVSVGIGTTAPIATLDIQGNAGQSGMLHVGGNGPNAYPLEGAYLGWNMSGGRGETDFVNNEGEGSGGWYFVNTNSSGGYSGWSAFLDTSGNLHSSSSRRWKTNINTLRGALDKVEQLRGVSYDRKDSGKHEIGVIAEEVGAVVPEVVSWDKNGTDALGVDYAHLTALLIEATKEQQSLIREQKEQITAQQAQIAKLAREVKTIRASLKANQRSGSAVRTAKAEGTAVRQ